MSAQEVKVRFSAIDQLSSAIKKIQGNLGKFREPAAKIQGAFNTLGSALGGRQTYDTLLKARDAAKDLGSEIYSVALTAGAFAAGIVGPAFGLVKMFAGVGDEIGETAEKLGISTQLLQEYRYAAKIAGIEQEGFDKSLRKLGQSAALATVGMGEALPAFLALGINVKDKVTGRVREVKDLLPELADAFSKIGNAGVKNALAMKIFGKEGANMTLLLNKGRDGIAELRMEALSLGGVLGDQTVKRAGDFQDQLDRVMFAVKGAGMAIAEELLPTFQNLAKDLLSFLKNNREEISAFGRSFRTVLEGVLGVARTVFYGIAAAVKIFDMMPAWMQTTALYAVMAALATLMAGALAISAYNFATSLAVVAGAMVNIIANLGIMTPLYTGFMTAVSRGAGLLGATVAGFKALALAIFGVGKAFLGFLFTNPIGWIVLAVSTLALLIYKWNEWGDTIIGVGKSVAGVALAFMGPFGWMIGAIVLLVKRWKDVGDILEMLFTDPSKALLSFVKLVLSELGYLGEWMANKFGLKLGSEVAIKPSGAPAGNDMALAAISGVNASSKESTLNVNFSNIPRGTTVQPSANNDFMPNVFMGYAGVSQ